MNTALLTRQASVESYKKRIAEEKGAEVKHELEKCLASEQRNLSELEAESSEKDSKKKT